MNHPESNPGHTGWVSTLQAFKPFTVFASRAAMQFKTRLLWPLWILNTWKTVFRQWSHSHIHSLSGWSGVDQYYWFGTMMSDDHNDMVPQCRSHKTGLSVGLSTRTHPETGIRRGEVVLSVLFKTFNHSLLIHNKGNTSCKKENFQNC